MTQLLDQINSLRHRLESGSKLNGVLVYAEEYVADGFGDERRAAAQHLVHAHIVTI